METQDQHILQIDIELIQLCGDTQSRFGFHEDTLADYAEAMKRGDKFPPVNLYYDGNKYWLGDGFHRVYAAQRAKLPRILAVIRQGNHRDAVLYAVEANRTHGLRRTSYDKRRAVEILLTDDEWRQWSDREIARRCGVGNKFVGDIRRSLCSEHSESNRAYTTKHGTPAKMRTGNIGNGVSETRLATSVKAEGVAKCESTLPESSHIDKLTYTSPVDVNAQLGAAPLARVENDFYPTGTRLTEILLEQVDITGRIVEPCAGDGAIAKLLPNCISNDFYPNLEYDCDYKLDATMPETWEQWSEDGFDWVVTNPPFSSAPKIIPLAFQHAAVGIAMLLRLSYLEPCKDRAAWLKANSDHLSNLIVLNPRPRFRNDTRGSDNITVAWFVWRLDWIWEKCGVPCPFTFVHGWDS